MAVARATRLGRVGRVPSARIRRRLAPDPLLISMQFERAIGQEYDLIVAEVMAQINPLLIQFGARQDGWRQDISIREILARVARGLRIPAILRRIFGLVERDGAQTLREQLPGVPVSEVLISAEQLQERWIRANTNLIKLPDHIQREVEKVITPALARGVRVEALRDTLEKQFALGKRRSQLIARDQTLKLAGQIQAARHAEAGISRYVWTTVRDERVRERHGDLDGTMQRWNDPPIVDFSTNRHEHPGGDFQCRCSAFPVVD